MRNALLLLGLLCWSVYGGDVWAQEDSMSRSERKAVKRRVKDAAKAEKQANKEFEKNYKELQKRHYKHQQTSREKNFIRPDGKDESVSGREGGHAKDNVRKRMRKGQQKARRNRDGRAIPWWRRVRLRRSWKKS
ncbi:MAG TPA: hypothetical protein DCL98_02875 [Flavobacteriales bacterium]|nr:hypothetical protein [Flavobacteriales bacterium]